MVDYIHQQIDESHELKKHAENPEEYVCDLNFSDDIVLFDGDDVTAVEHCDILQNSTSQVGLTSNKDKTKLCIKTITENVQHQKLLKNLKL